MSGLPKNEEFKYGEHTRLNQADESTPPDNAIGWQTCSYWGTIEWIGKRDLEAEQAAREQADAERPPSQYELERQASEAAKAKLTDQLRTWVDDTDTDAIMARAAQMLTADVVRQLDGTSWGAEFIVMGECRTLARDGEHDYVTQLAQDPVRFAAVEIFTSTVVWLVDNPPTGDYDKDRRPLYVDACRHLLEIGIELDDTHLEHYTEWGGEMPAASNDVEATA